MKTIVRSTFVVLMFVASALAQVPSTISYQGRLQSGTTPFTGNGHFKFAIVSTGTDISEQATASASVVNGFLTAVTVTYQGAFYASPPTVTITDPTGSGATATANLSSRGGAVVSITVNNAGHNYSNPTVTIAPPPANYVYVAYWSNDGTSFGGSEPVGDIPVSVQQGLFMVLLGNTNLPNMLPITPSVFENPNTFLRIWFSDGTNGFVRLTPDQPLAAVAYAMVAGGSVQSAPGEPMVFRNGATEAMRIDAAGNVGIATTTPTVKFQVAGDARIGSTSYTQGFENFFFPPSGWATSGDAAWARTTDTASEGIASAVSGAIGDNQSSFLQYEFVFPSAGVITFRWKVSSEGGYDFLTSCLDTDCTRQISGEVDWTEVIVPVSEGYHVLTWKYTKDINLSRGLDKAWIDNVRFGQGGDLTVDGHLYVKGQIQAPQATLSRINVDTASPAGRLEVNGPIGVSAGVKSLNAGIAAEVGSDLVNFGLNDGPFNRFGGTYVSGFQGGFFRVDSRPGAHLFTFNGRTNGSTVDTAQLGYIDASGTVRFEIGTGQKFSLGGNGNFEIDAFGTIGGRFTVLNNGNVGIGNAAPGAKLQVVNATCNGTTWANASDRNLKENFEKVNAAEILDRVLGLSVTEWNYKDSPAERHVGPVSQDFRAAFGLGASDKHIATVDADGVALVAIQGLNQKLEAELCAKTATIKQLEERISRLEKIADRPSGVTRKAE